MPYCAVVSCQSGSKKPGEKYQMFQLPDPIKSKGLRTQWLNRLNRNFIPTEHTRVCAKHFQQSDFVPEEKNLDAHGKPKKKKTLIPSAIPSLHLRPDVEVESRQSSTSKRASTVPSVVENEPIDEFHSYCIPPEHEPHEPMDLDLASDEERETGNTNVLLLTASQSLILLGNY